MSADAKYVYRESFSVAVFVLIPATLCALSACSGRCSALALALNALWVWSFGKILVTPPGCVPETDEWLFHPRSERIRERTRAGLLRFSHAANVFYPDRAHFDARQGRVVLRMDHYCPWLGQVIGNDNYRYFHQLLFFSSAAALYYFCAFARECARSYRDHSVPWGYVYIMFLGIILALFVSVAALALFALHSFLILTNRTMIEWLQDPRANPWHTGSYLQNVKQVYPLSRNALACLLSFGPPAHDGVYFDRGESQPLLASEIELSAP